MDVSAAILIRSSWVVIEERWPTKSFLRQVTKFPRRRLETLCDECKTIA
uniref:Transposase n=1 Tax=Heterorhabditis bacteriophora TaxID=37862 RepID=A0A1I7WY19_HETBA